jgi:hypothetical protein
MLTGKISRDSRPADTRLGQREMPFYKDYFTEPRVCDRRCVEGVRALSRTDGSRGPPRSSTPTSRRPRSSFRQRFSHGWTR